MGAKLTAGVLGGTLVVLGVSAAASVQVLGQQSVGTGDAAAGRYAAARSADVARWLDPPDAEKYSAKQLVAALLAARATDGAVIAFPVPPEASGTLTGAPIAWRGSTSSTSGARVTVRIDADLRIRADRVVGATRQIDSKAARCFVYTVQKGSVTHVRDVRCPRPEQAMKPPKAAPLPTT